MVGVAWEVKQSGNGAAFSMQVCVPANVAADVWVPGAAAAVAVVGCCPCNYTGGW